MNIPNKLTEENIILQAEDGRIGLFGYWLISKFQQHPRAEEHQHQHDGHAAESPCQGEFHCAFRYRPGPEVQNQTVKETSKPVPICSRIEETGKNGIPDALEDSTLIRRYVLLWIHFILVSNGGDFA
ncbi:hypothetical protein ES703_89914 [subsurface metagenome]